MIEASKQCRRNVLMRSPPAGGWLDWCVTRTGPRFVAHPGGPDRGVVAADGVTVAVGPEGGFTESEVEAAVATGWERLGLGPRVLHVETAALAAAVFLGQRAR